MATYYNDVELSIMSESGDAHIIYPITHENNVVIGKPTFYTGTDNINTLRNLIAKLGSASFAAVSGVTDAVTHESASRNPNALVNQMQLYNQFATIQANIQKDITDKIESGAFKGDKGDKGDNGLIGPEGPTGPTGVRGNVPVISATNPNGNNGTYYFFNKSLFNNISLSVGDGFIWRQASDKVWMCRVNYVENNQYRVLASEIVNLRGPQGAAGANGSNGVNGSDGAAGPQGPTGATGTFDSTSSISMLKFKDNSQGPASSAGTACIQPPEKVTGTTGLEIITGTTYDHSGGVYRGIGLRLATCAGAIFSLIRRQSVSSSWSITTPNTDGEEWGSVDQVQLGGGLFNYATQSGSLGTVRQTVDLGSNSNPFGTIYSTSNSLNSDEKMKKDRTLISDDVYEEIFDDIEFIKYRWKYNQNTALDSRPSSRFHYGLIAQEVEEVFHKHGIDNSDSGIISANFFLNNTTGKFISGGHQTPFEKDGITYSYSENVWNFKHGLEYRTYNEIIEKEMWNLVDEMPERRTIGYLSFEDNSKVAEGVHAPNIKINGAYLVDADDNYTPLEFVEGESVALYSILDPEFTTPRTHDKFNEDGSVEILYDDCDSWQNARHMLRIKTPFDATKYMKIVLDMEYIGEYKVYLMPDVHYNHSNHYFSETYGNTECFDYSLNYTEFTMMALSVLQKTKKRQEEEINDLKEVNETLLTKLDELESRLAALEK